MTISRSTIRRILALPLAFILLSAGLVWFQESASPAAAQEPGATITISIVPVDEAGIAEVGPTPIFNVGDTFAVAVTAQGVPDPGVFGGQFEVSYDPTRLAVLAGSLVPGSSLEPALTPVQEIDNTAGLVRFAASRQGDVDNVLGNVVLATLTFEAIAPTEPPAGQTTAIALQNVKLGAKGGIEVPVTGIVGLSVIIRGTVEPPPSGADISGNVMAQGRAADNQAGHEVTATDGVSTTLSATTALTGSFAIVDAPAGTYTVTAASPGFLGATCPGVVHDGTNPTVLADAALLAGDLDSSGAIDISDAVAIGAVFGSAGAQVADLNADGVVDILDLILMAANFGQTSEGNPWVCQPVSL